MIDLIKYAYMASARQQRIKLPAGANSYIEMFNVNLCFAHFQTYWFSINKMCLKQTQQKFTLEISLQYQEQVKIVLQKSLGLFSCQFMLKMSQNTNLSK